MARAIDADNVKKNLQQLADNIKEYGRKTKGHRYFKPDQVVYILDKIMECYIDKEPTMERTE